jgi:hypothetical protein
MKLHPCEWASEKGRQMKLSCPERVVLWQLARRAVSKGFCWPSVVQLMEDTGLARQTVLTVVHKLDALGLITITRQGQKHVYTVHYPVQNKTGERSDIRPEEPRRPVQNKTGGRSDIRPDEASDRSKNQPEPVQKRDANRSKIATRTSKEEPEKEPYARVRTREAVACDREPEKEDFKIEKENVDPPPAAQPDTFNAHLENPTAGSALPNVVPMPRRAARLAMPPGETVTAELPDDEQPLDTERALAEFARVKQALRSRNYPPRAPILDSEQQQDVYRAAQIRPGAAHLTGDHLVIARQMAARRFSIGALP